MRFIALARKDSMRTLLVCLALCFASQVCAKQQAKTAKDDQLQAETHQDKRGTKEQPLVIEGVLPLKDEAEIRELRAYRAKQTAIGTEISDSLTYEGGDVPYRGRDPIPGKN